MRTSSYYDCPSQETALGEKRSKREVSTPACLLNSNSGFWPVKDFGLLNYGISRSSSGQFIFNEVPEKI